MTQLATVQNAYNYLNVRQVQHFRDLFGGSMKKATSFLAVAIGQLQKNPKLLQCEERSVRDSLIEAAQVDLVPGGSMQHCFLVPYGRECTLQIGYRGLVELCQREGAVNKVWANVVYQDEVDKGLFIVHAGSEHSLTHNRDPFREDPPSWADLLEAGLVGAYACAELHNGAVNFEVVGLDVLKRAKAMSRSDAWDNWATEMVKKFPLKRLCKRLPKTLLLEKFHEIEEKNRGREVIQLGAEVDAVPPGKTAGDWEPAVGRKSLEDELQEKFRALSDDQIVLLGMDRELDDYFHTGRTSDDQVAEFLQRVIVAGKS